MWLLKEHGGIWCDTDTRFIKPLEPLLDCDITTVHRNGPMAPLDEFHQDQCIVGAVKDSKMIDLVIERAYEDSKGRGIDKYTWNFNTTLTGRCPSFIKYGPYDETGTKAEREDFINCKFNEIVPKRDNSYIRHYLTGLHCAK
jgi:hypothetical protein